MKKYIQATVKLILPLGLFVYLLMSVAPEDYQAFLQQRKRWDLLLLSQISALAAIVVSFVRWRLLVLAFDISFSFKECFRLGFLGYLLNFISFGSVGGDVFKAILVARDKVDKRPEAIASVLLDRSMGLLGLVVLAWLSLTVLPLEPLPATLLVIRRGAGIIALGSIAALMLCVYSGRWFDRLVNWGEGAIPLVGSSLARMARAVRQLRGDALILPLLLLMAVVVHGLLAMSLYLVSCGIYAEHPTLREHFMVVLPGMAAGALPLAPGGIGVQEGAIVEMFKQLPNLPASYSPMIVATVYRLITIAIAGIGMIYYFASHGREFRFVSSQVESLESGV